MKIVVIDPGHSGPVEPGACGSGGTQEADVTLQVGQKLADLLGIMGLRTIMTRTGPIDDDGLTWRAEVANEYAADAFISVHCNGAENRDAEGYEVFTAPGQTDSDVLADCIFVEIQNEFPDLDPRTDESDGDVDKEANYTVLTATDCPAVLVELEFITNPVREQQLSKPEFQIRYAQAIARGVATFLGVGK